MIEIFTACFSAEIIIKEHRFAQKKKKDIQVILKRYQMGDHLKSKSALGSYAGNNISVFTPADVAQ